MPRSQYSPAATDEYQTFNRPGYAKIVLGVHAEPIDETSTRLMLDTRVLTDPGSEITFRRFWRLMGRFSGLIRRIAMRELAAELNPPSSRLLTSW